MSLGEIPGNVRAYYKLEDLTDSSGNGYTLTNNNSVTFGAGKFNNASDFGSSGTNKSLLYTGNVLTSTGTTFDCGVSLWFKLNSTANTTYNHNLFDLANGVSGLRVRLFYTISGGTITLFGRSGAAGGASVSFTADTNWHHVFFRRNYTDTVTVIEVDGGTYTANGGLGSGADVSALVCIGNNGNALNLQVKAMIDECFIYEDLYIRSSLGAESNRRKYYTQAKGRFL